VYPCQCFKLLIYKTEEPHLQSVLKQDVRIFKYSMVDNVEVSEHKKWNSNGNNCLLKVLTPAGEIRDLPPFSKELIQKNEKEGLQRGKRDFDRIGKDVSPQAQLLFNSLDKTYRLRWESKDIRINELGIVIKSPYNPENCSGKDLAALERIKLLVAKINERIRSGELTL